MLWRYSQATRRYSRRILFCDACLPLRVCDHFSVTLVLHIPRLFLSLLQRLLLIDTMSLLPSDFELPIRVPRLSLLILFWHPVVNAISAFNWLFFTSDETNLLGSQLTRAHIAFNVIGALVYLILSAVFIFWPYRFGAFMLGKTRRNRLALGSILVYFSHILPCWMIEFAVVWNHGWFSVLQGTSFVLLTMSFIVETVVVWVSYIWHMAGFMQANYGNTVFGRGTLLQ